MTSMSAPLQILVAAEDPGAANMLAGLPSFFAAGAAEVTVWACGRAVAQFADRGVASVSPPGLIEDAAVGGFDVVVVGTAENPETFTHAIVDAAHRVGVASVGVVDAPMHAAWRFRGGDDPLAHLPDDVVVADAATADRFVALGVERDAVVVCGHPHHDHVVASGIRFDADGGRAALRARLFPAAGDRPVVVFAAEISDGVDAAEYRRSADYLLTGRGDVDGRTEIVLEEFCDATAAGIPDAWRVLRLHPKNTRDEFARWLGEFDQVSAGGPGIEVVYAADLVVGMATMLLVEAALLGTPTLSVLPRIAERDWLPGLSDGVTPVVHTRAALRAELARLRAAPRPAPACPDAHAATDRCAAVVRAAAQRTAAMRASGLLPLAGERP